MDTTETTHKLIIEIKEAAARAGGVESTYFQTKHLSKVANMFKQSAMYLARQHGHSFEEIASAFGLKSHASVAYACRQVKANLHEPVIRAVLAKVKKELYG